VEFAGSAVTSPSPAGANISIANSDFYTSWLVANNAELQWSDLYYRGYYELEVSHDSVQAQYFGMPTVVSRNPYEIPLANFTVKSGENKLSRPVGGGLVESGTLRGGTTKHTNLSKSPFLTVKVPFMLI
jgi:alkaline phosphatase D